MSSTIVARRGPLAIIQRTAGGIAKVYTGENVAEAARQAGIALSAAATAGGILTDVTTAGTDALTAIGTAQTTAVGAVNTAGTTQVTAVNTAGATNTAASTAQANRATLQAYLSSEPFADTTALNAYTNASLALNDSVIIPGDGRYMVTSLLPLTWTRQSDSDGKLATTKAGEAAVSAAAAASVVLPIFPDDGYASGFFGTDGFPVLATLIAGGIVGLVGNLPSAQFLFPDDGYSVTFGGSDGSVVAGVSINAPTTAYATLQPILETDGSLRLLTATSDIKIAAPQGTILSPPEIAGTLLKWIDKQGAVRERRQFNLAAPWARATYTKLVMVPMIGQSLTVGYKSGALYTTAAVATGRALMFSGGARPLAGPTWLNGTDNADVLADTQLSTLVDLTESLVGVYGETHLSGAGYWLNKVGVVEATSAMMFDAVGLGSAPISTLWKGTQNYANFIRAVERGKAIADYIGVAFEVPCVLMDQGENDYGASAAAYLTNLLQLQADLTTDINAITGGSGQVKLLCWAPSSWTAPAFALATAGSPIGITDGALSYPTRIGVIGPQYFNPYWDADGVHALSHGLRNFGEYGGRAVAAVRGGGSTGGLFATSAAVVGTALTVTFNANIALDTTLVSDPGQRGVRLFNGASELALSSIAVAGNKLTATVASAPGAGTWKIGIADKGTAGNNAGPTTGPRSNIRDASADMASDGTTYLYNWALHQQIACAVS